jgi:hypothetical protein
MGFMSQEKVMSSKRMFKIKSTKNFLNKHLDHSHYTINQLNEQISDLYEMIYQNQDNNDNEDELLQEVNDLEMKKQKSMHTSITLCGWDWLKLLAFSSENGYHYTTKNGDTYYVFPFRQASIDPNLKYRLGFWLGGEVTLFPVGKRRVSMSPQTKQRKRLSREEKRDKGH